MDRDITWDDILEYFKGTELHDYFKKVANKELRVVHKIQHVDLIRKYVKGRVGDILSKVDERGLLNLSLIHI